MLELNKTIYRQLEETGFELLLGQMMVSTENGIRMRSGKQDQLKSFMEVSLNSLDLYDVTKVDKDG